MSKLPRLDEVFIINVGSAYSLKKEAGFPNKKNLQRRTYGSNVMEANLKPEFQKIVDKYAKGDKELAATLTAFAHEIEGAEGEDPGELDQGGPAPGSTGGHGE
jgi:hypothetical protein